MKGDDKTMSSLQDDFSEKYEKYSSTIFKIAITYLANKADAEDVMQDVFIKLLYSSPDFDNDDYEKFWIIRTTSNICKNMLKSFQHKNTEDIDDFKEFLAEPSKTNIAELLLELNPKHRILNKRLPELHIQTAFIIFLKKIIMQSIIQKHKNKR